MEFFKKVRISAVALIKMIPHARSGGSLEIMGLMRGKVAMIGEFIVMDASSLARRRNRNEGKCRRSRQ